SLLMRAVEQGLAAPSVLQCWDAYAAARNALLPDQAELVDHPLLYLAADPGLRERARSVLDSFAAALQAVQEVADALRLSGSYESAKEVRSKGLCLDLVFIRSRDGFNALAAPTHPFHLWRWLALFDLATAHRIELAGPARDSVAGLVSDPPAG